MKKIILTIILMPTLVFADVTVHQDEFNFENINEGTHFWVRLFDWDQWSENDKQKSLKITTNFVKEAYDNGESEYGADDLDEDEVESLLGDPEGPALYSFYEERLEKHEEDPLDPADIGGPSGLVTATKISVDLPKNFEVSNLNLDKVSNLVAEADQPHIHTEVSKDFAHQFVDQLHSAHKEVDNLENGKIVLSIINTGSDYYRCGTLNTLLKLKGSVVDKITTYDGDFRTYIINTLVEMDMNVDFKGKGLIEGQPSKVFRQKVIYSSNIIKAGFNFIAFYELPDGKKKMVLNSVIVSTGEVKNSLGQFVNGVGVTNELFSGIKLENGEVVLDSNNLDLDSLKGGCSKGLGQGMGRYVLGLAESIAKSPLLIK